MANEIKNGKDINFEAWEAEHPFETALYNALVDAYNASIDWDYLTNCDLTDEYYDGYPVHPACL